MSNTTVHKSTTQHGYKTPHKLPTKQRSELDIFNDLAKQLYPTGRAWYMPENGVWENFHTAINQSFIKLLEECNSLINGTFPDNSEFTTQDATLWEYRLGLITNESIDISVRIEAIKRKLGHPNNVKARQHPLFIQSQLQAAGFNVWVHENTIPYKNPQDVANVGLIATEHGDTTQHGVGVQHGGESFEIIANSIEEVESFAVGNENLWATFFLGGEILGTLAEIPYSRLREFKELVIKLKPAHTAAFTFVNYI